MISEDTLTRDLKKILLICFGGLGDVVLFYPVVKTLKDLYPKSEIVFVVEPRSKIVAEKNPYIKKVITFDLKNNPKMPDYLYFIKQLRNENADLAISMGRSSLVPVLLFLSGAKHRVGYATNKLSFLYSKSVKLNQEQYAAKMYFDLLKGVGIDADILNPIPEIIIPKEDLNWAKNWLSEKNTIPGENKIVTIHPGASKISKQKNILKTWDPLKWAKLIDILTENQVKVILTGGPDDEEDIKIILENCNSDSTFFVNGYGATKNLDQLGAIITNSNLLICVDSAPMNVGVGVGVPIVAIYGPTNEKKLLPPDERFTPVRINLECTPCLWDKRQTTCEALTCLKDLDLNTVLSKVLEKLNIKAQIKC